MPDPTTPIGEESKVPGNESEISNMAIEAVFTELEKRGFSRSDFPLAMALGAGALQAINEGRPSVTVDNVLMWLGQWRDSLPAQAIQDLQALCDRE